MPRLREVSRAEAAPSVLAFYDEMFEDRDPTVERGTPSGSPGTYWTVLALSPDAFEWVLHGIRFSNADRELSPLLRELGLTRTGWARGSQFVFSQHCKGLRSLGVPEEKIKAIPGWAASDLFEPVERLVLSYTDDLVLNGGRVPDATFEALRRHLSDKDILDLTYIVTQYEMHATVCRALRVEFDDRDDPVVEVPAPERPPGTPDPMEEMRDRFRR